MSVASQWKLKEKEAAAAAAVSKTGIYGVNVKTEASVKDASGGGGAVGGKLGFKGQIEKPGKPEAAKPAPPQATPFAKQGQGKLPVVKDTAKSPQSRETDAAHTKDGATQQVGGIPPTSKIPVGAKENISSVGVRKPFGSVGSGPKKEEPPLTFRSKAEDSKAKAVELKNEPEGGAKDSAAAAGDEGPFGSGRTKGLAGFWANQNDEVKAVKKKRLTAVEENLTPMVVENTPQQLEGVVRAQDPGEWKKPLQVEDGWTKNVVSSLQKRQQESFARRAPVSLVEDTPNEMSDATQDAEAAKVKVKDISQRLVKQQSEPTNKPKEKLVLDISQGAIVLAENQPMEVDPDVVRSDDASKEEVVLEKGRTRNLLQLWKNTEVEYNTPKTSTSRYQGSKPAWILEIEAAKGNAPENKDDNGEYQENDTMEANDENDTSAAIQLPERASEPEVPSQTEDKQNIVLDNYPCKPLPKEMGNEADITRPKESTSAEKMQALKSKTDTDETVHVGENFRTTNKDISCEETPAIVSLDVVSQVQVAGALPDLVPNKIEVSEKPLTPALDKDRLIAEAGLEQTSKTPAPIVGTKLKDEVCEQVSEYEPIQNRHEEEKEVSKVLPEERKSNSEVLSDVISSSSDQNKALQESNEGEKVHKLSLEEITPIHEASENIPQNESVLKQQLLLSGSPTTALDQQEPDEKVCEEVHQLPSSEIKLKQASDEPHQTSDVASNMNQAENIGKEISRSESEVAFEQSEAEINKAEGVESIQRHDAIAESPQDIAHDSPSNPTNDSVSKILATQPTLPLPQDFLDYSVTPEETPNRVPGEVVKIQSESLSVSEENKVDVTSETHETFSDHETFSTPTTTPVILTSVDPVINTKQIESCESEPKELTAEKNENRTSDETSFTEGGLIDLQAESSEKKRENATLISLDDLLRIEPSPNLEYSTADNTPCLVPVSSPNTPELGVNSERSSGFFDSDAEKDTVWFSPREEQTVTTTKTKIISTQKERENSSESVERKAGDGKATGKKVEPANKADTSQRSCRVM